MSRDAIGTSWTSLGPFSSEQEAQAARDLLLLGTVVEPPGLSCSAHSYCLAEVVGAVLLYSAHMHTIAAGE